MNFFCGALVPLYFNTSCPFFSFLVYMYCLHHSFCSSFLFCTLCSSFLFLLLHFTLDPFFHQLYISLTSCDTVFFEHSSYC